MAQELSMEWFRRSLDPESDCPLCCEPFSLTNEHFPERLGCGHWFCKECLLTHMNTSPTRHQCPECRTPLLGVRRRNHDSDSTLSGSDSESDTDSEPGSDFEWEDFWSFDDDVGRQLMQLCWDEVRRTIDDRVLQPDSDEETEDTRFRQIREHVLLDLEEVVFDSFVISRWPELPYAR